MAAAPNAQAAYAASKGGLINLTRELAAQWAKHRIRVDAIAPGYFETELTEAMFVGEDAGLRYIRRNTLLGRPGELEELDGVAAPRLGCRHVHHRTNDRGRRRLDGPLRARPLPVRVEAGAAAQGVPLGDTSAASSPVRTWGTRSTIRPGRHS